MSRPNNRRREPGGNSAEATLLWVGLVLVGIVVGSVYLAVRIGHHLAGTSAGLPDDPFEVFFGLLRGRVSWPPAGTWVLVGIAVVLAAIGVAVALGLRATRRRRTRVDSAAVFMGRGRDIEALSHKHASATATRLGVSQSPGVPIGRTVAGGKWLYAGWEDTHLDIWGPRTGKTTSRAIPAIAKAPGSVLCTSNKRDAVDATRDLRATVGPVWVFDPQAIALEEPTWWWNPLSYVTDEVRAARLAGHFAAGSRDPNARTDGFFDPAAQDLLAGLLLAAALDGRPITDVYTWLTRETDETPADILREHGIRLTADQVAGVISAPDKQRGGIYGVARQMASCLTTRATARWVTPKDGVDLRPQFDPEAFVRSTGTLYSLSKEGKGTAGPLVTALTVAVMEAAEEFAIENGGRLPTPMLAVLDEVANVCKWADLPDLYSHYGSRGIILMAILQSWSQGVDVWGESGMKKLWSAATVRVYGGGVGEMTFLEDLARLIGPRDRQSSSVSTSRGNRTVSTQLHRERILDVDDLGALPKGRAVVLASGSRPTLIRTQPWMTGPHAAAIRASIAAHDPQATKTIREAEAELEAVTAANAALEKES
jgi:type IV secretory pathway TraG/TraD family ATPase VirD4